MSRERGKGKDGHRLGIVNFIERRPILLGRPRPGTNRPGKAPNRSTRYHGGH